MKIHGKDCYHKKIIYLKAAGELTEYIYNKYCMYLKKEFICCLAKGTVLSMKGCLCLKDTVGPASHMFIDNVSRGHEVFLFFDDRYAIKKYLAAYIPKKEMFIFADDDLHPFLPSLSLESCYSLSKSPQEQEYLESCLEKAADFFAKSDSCCI